MERLLWRKPVGSGEDRVHQTFHGLRGAEVRDQLDDLSHFPEPALDLPVQGDVRAAEAIDRLLRIPHDEERPRAELHLVP